MVDRLRLQIVLLAHNYRIGAIGAASDGFAKLIDDLIHFLQAAPAGVDPAQLLPWIQQGLAAQQRADFLELADILQFEVSPRLLPAPR